MKYYSQLKLYKASNLTYNPEIKEAVSYRWWRFVRLIGDKTIFNTCKYSNTTARHQYLIKKLMFELGHKIDLEVNSLLSLNNPGVLKDSIKRYKRRIETLEIYLADPKTRPAKNKERKHEITTLRGKIEDIENLQAEVDKTFST